MKYKYVGKSTERKDAVGIVTGSATFLNDFSVPRMLYGKCLKSPYPHALIKSINVEKARQLPGVAAVLTYKDVPAWKAGLPAHRKVLDQKVRYVGDGVALVAADTEEIAEEALKLIEVEYEVLPAVFDADEAIKPGAPQLYEEFPNNILTPGCPLFEHGGPPFYQLMRGDVDKAFEECAVVVEGSASYDKFPSPMAPEAPACISSWSSDTDLDCWASTQSPNLFKNMAEMRMPGVRIHCRSFNVGGSYGNKQTLVAPLFYSAALAKATHRPVKYAMTKAEQLIDFDERLGSKLTAKVGLLADGTIHAVEGMWLVDTGASSDLAQGQTAVGLGEVQLLMAKCKNWKLDTRLVCTNRVPSGIVKGFGGQELKSALMPLVEEGMQKLGIDPVECFSKNIIEPGDHYTWRNGVDQCCREMNHLPALFEGAEKFGWKDKFKGWGVPYKKEGSKVYAVGMSCGGNADAGEDDSEAYVRLNYDGSVTLHCLITESGMGQRNSAAKMVAEVLHAPFEKVQISIPDTIENPADFGLAGSRGTKTVGTACCLAAMDAKKKLLEHASKFMNVPADKLDTESNFVYEIDNPEHRMAWMEMMSPLESFTGFGRYNEDFSTPNFFFIFVEVEVDLETGEVRLVDQLGSANPGTVIDPVQLKMQFEGGIGAAGTDTALFEGHVLDPVTGRVMTGNMIDYKWRTFNMFTHYESVFCESEPDVSPMKAVGCGEVSGAAAPAAIMMALTNALGTPIASYPATPDVILDAIHRKEAK